MRFRQHLGIAFAICLLSTSPRVFCQKRNPVSVVPASKGVPLSEFLDGIRQKAKTLESSSGMRLGFQSFTAAHHLSAQGVHYSDYVLVRQLFEATRDAGFWNLHWSVTDQPPNSDNIWRQWHTMPKPSVWEPTATAECDELSALFAFFAERAGVRTVGLFWPAPNHTVAVWVLHPTNGNIIRVVVPTSQIFLEETDFFDTKKFDPWRQKTIYEYTRRDVPDSFELPKPLAEFFLQQIDKYAGASDLTLQRLRYLRDAVLTKSASPEQAARDALARRAALPSGSTEDASAFQAFADDMRLEVLRE